MLKFENLLDLLLISLYNVHWYDIELIGAALFKYLFANRINIVNPDIVTILLLFKIWVLYRSKSYVRVRTIVSLLVNLVKKCMLSV